MTASITVQQDRSTPTALLHSPGVRLKASDHLNAFCVHTRMHTRIHFLLVVHFISTHLESSSCSNKVRFSSQVTDRSRQFRYFFPSFINTRFPLHLEHQLHTHTHTRSGGLRGTLHMHWSLWSQEEEPFIASQPRKLYIVWWFMQMCCFLFSLHIFPYLSTAHQLKTISSLCLVMLYALNWIRGWFFTRLRAFPQLKK